MNRLSADDIQDILRHLDQAVYNHERWYEGLSRSMVCRLPHDERDLSPSAHRLCQFGQWYYGRAAEHFQQHAAFEAIGAEHKFMHQLASRVLLSMTKDQPVSTLDYDQFANSLQRLRLQIATLKRELQDSLYNRDSLTGLSSRLGMLTRLRELLELVKRDVQPCSICMMDIDHFKKVNDTRGHQVGDQVLREVAKYVLGSVRPYDSAFRYGGEEFLLAMQSTGLAEAQEVAERLRQGIAELAIDVGMGLPLSITVSFGLASLDPHEFAETSVGRADLALYAAKSAGRNCMRVWDPAMGDAVGLAVDG
jgi:diguanylate cyclase (GGDEF)-like protein